MNNIDDFKREIDKILNTGRSGDLDAFGCSEYNPELTPKLIKLFNARTQEIVEEVLGNDDDFHDTYGSHSRNILREEQRQRATSLLNPPNHIEEEHE